MTKTFFAKPFAKIAKLVTFFTTVIVKFESTASFFTKPETFFAKAVENFVVLNTKNATYKTNFATTYVNFTKLHVNFAKGFAKKCKVLCKFCFGENKEDKLKAGIEDNTLHFIAESPAKLIYFVRRRDSSTKIRSFAKLSTCQCNNLQVPRCR